MCFLKMTVETPRCSHSTPRDHTFDEKYLPNTAVQLLPVQMYSKVYPPSNGCCWSNFFKAPAFSPVCKPHGAFTNVVYIGFTQRKKGQEKNCAWRSF